MYRSITLHWFMRPASWCPLSYARSEHWKPTLLLYPSFSRAASIFISWQVKPVKLNFSLFFARISYAVFIFRNCVLIVYYRQWRTKRFLVFFVDVLFWDLNPLCVMVVIFPPQSDLGSLFFFQPCEYSCVVFLDVNRWIDSVLGGRFCNWLGAWNTGFLSFVFRSWLEELRILEINRLLDQLIAGGNDGYSSRKDSWQPIPHEVTLAEKAVFATVFQKT